MQEDAGSPFRFSLINRLQGPLPPLIPKVHLHDLQASRDANIRAFVLASRGLAIGSNDTMQPGDISDTASSATQRIVTSILALARLAGPQGSEPGSPNLKFSSQNAPTRRQVVPERVSGATPISRGTPRNIPPVVPPTRHRPTASNSPEDSVSGGHGKVALSKELPGSSTNGQLAGQSTLRSADKPLAHVAVAQKQADVPATKGSNRPTSSSMERSTRSSTPSLILSSSNARTSWTASEPAELRDSGTGLSGYRHDLITSSRVHLQHSQYISIPVKIPRLFDTMLDETAAKIASKTTDVDNTNPGQPVSAHVKESPPRRQPIRSVSPPGVPSLNSSQATPSKTKGESVVVTTHGHTAVYVRVKLCRPPFLAEYCYTATGQHHRQRSIWNSVAMSRHFYGSNRGDQTDQHRRSARVRDRTASAGSRVAAQTQSPWHRPL